MSQQNTLLDLRIQLTPPPHDALPPVLASVVISCDTLNQPQASALLNDPLSPDERQDLIWYLEEYWKWPYLGFAERGRGIETLMIEVGKRLYHAIFGTIQAQSLLQEWRNDPGGGHQISIVSELPRVLSLPWELLHDEQRFMILYPDHPISLVRSFPQDNQLPRSMPFEPPLRILMVTARPLGPGFIDPRSIARELVEEVQPQVETGAIDLEFLRPPTFSALKTRLDDSERPPVHILHFDGHGVLDEKSGQGQLVFETKEGGPSYVPARNIAKALKGSGVSLVVLTACQSAMSTADDAFSSVSAQLIRSGIGAVVAMSASVLVTSAARYVEAFYRALAAGIPVLTAHQQARQALYDDPRRHLHRLRRDEEGEPIELCDWWLPHFYQQQPLVLQPTKPLYQNKKQQNSLPRLSKDMPAAPCYNFSGRARELHQIERGLSDDKLVVIHGFGGVGKTTLVREAADWLTRTGMYEGACFVSFERGRDAAVLLSALGNYLDLNDDLNDPDGLKAAVERLEPVLKERRILVILDSLESLLLGGNAQLGGEVLKELYEVLLMLQEMKEPLSVKKVGVLLTSRGKVFDGKPNNVIHLPLHGLDTEDAYTFASQLMDTRGIDRACAPYAELRDLLVQLDHHPLAIQLVLPALRKVPLARIKSDFSKLLELKQFADQTVEGRNASLEASLQYSLQGLSAEQRAWLIRLALFEGGARESDLLVITEIPESTWPALRSVLEQSGLLTPEQIPRATSVPYLHFHPVLAPYLRTQSGADDAVLRQRYIQRYYALADYLYEEDISNPQPVRALVKWELPNLQRAFELLLAADNVEGASHMAERIIKFLNNFGFWRERDALRVRLVEASRAEGAQGANAGGTLTPTDYLRERGKGDDEYRRRNVRAAFKCFRGLLARVEALPDGTPLGPGSFEQCQMLHRVARCLNAMGHPADAEGRLRQALDVVDMLVRKEPDNQGLIRERGVLLGDLADVLCGQGRYPQAQEMFEEALKVDERLDDERGQVANLAQLGTLELVKRDYAEAQKCYEKALHFFQKKDLNEPEMEAVAWHQLGIALQEQGKFAEAEQNYRHSLEIKQFLGHTTSAASTCNQLANLAEKVGHPREAEIWYRRALKLLELEEQGQPGTAGSPEKATILNNLADLLVNEVQASRAAKERLIEARNYAEQALAIREKLYASENIWDTLHLIAEIEDLQGQAEQARDYRRRERESFAAFAGSRYHIYQDHKRLVTAVVAAAKGNELELAAVEKALPSLEANGWHITTAMQRIWAGERDWYALTEGLDAQSALLVKLVLEMLTQSPEAQDSLPEQVPLAIHQVLEQDTAVFEQAFADLSPEELLRYQRALKEE